MVPWLCLVISDVLAYSQFHVCLFRIAFVEFSDFESMSKATSLDGVNVNGQSWRINASGQGSAGGFGGGNRGNPEKTVFVKGFDKYQAENSVRPKDLRFLLTFVFWTLEVQFSVVLKVTNGLLMTVFVRAD